MARVDRQFQQYRERALAAPVTRANQKIIPQIALPGGTMLGLSVNK